MLDNYFNILKEEKNAKYLLCKKIPVSFTIHDSLPILWKKHDEALLKKNINEKNSEKSLLDLKIEISKRIIKKCILCERKCKINRNISVGHCNVKNSKIVSEFLHFGEEKILIPSYTIFFSGCNLNCVYCQNWDISQKNNGYHYNIKCIVDLISKRKKQGAININWVGGDPTPNLNYILKILKYTNINIPQVWNSNMYCSFETMKLLNGVIDLFLSDFKYGNNTCAFRLSNVNNYLKIIKRNHLIAYKESELIIRHLVLPNHYECCSKKIINWISKNLPSTYVNIMSQYRPRYKSLNYNDISDSIEYNKYLKVINYAKNHNIDLI
jgi:putative pyruvate formate lyase activating enzyme